jgi:hypothetical protein
MVLLMYRLMTKRIRDDYVKESGRPLAEALQALKAPQPGGEAGGGIEVGMFTEPVSLISPMPNKASKSSPKR